MENFNLLEPQETERLALLAEEMGETLQIIGKILRHGYESFDPFLPPPAGNTNRQLLERELGDVLVAIDFMLRAGDVKQKHIDDKIRVKNHKIWDFLHHQPADHFE